MASKNSDYNKASTDVFELLPNVFKSDVNRALTDNVFNRYLTKTEMRDVVGVIGDPSNPRRVPELDSHRQAFQLQPIITNDTESETINFSFKDVMRRLSQLGTDYDKFDVWGELQLFNFVPPIDLDKLVNYRDYYWLHPSAVPQYITITNRKRQLWTIISQAYKDISELEELSDAYTSGADNGSIINQLYPGFTDILDEYQFILASDPLNQVNEDGWDKITWDPSLVGDWDNPLDGADIVGVSSASFIVQGNKAPLFTLVTNFSFQVSGSSFNDGLYQVAVAEYDASTDQTEVWVVGGGIDPTISDGKIMVGFLDFELMDYDPVVLSNWDAVDQDTSHSIPNPLGFIIQTDPWSQGNFWVHISDIPDGVNLSTYKQAQQPIIEYKPFLELNQWALVEHQWLYRGDETETESFNGSGKQPTDDEIFANVDKLHVPDTFVGSNAIAFDITFNPNALTELVVGREVSVEFLDLNTFLYYTIDDVSLVGNTLTVVLDKQLPSGVDSVYSRMYSIRRTSQGDDWKGFFNHWVYDGAKSPIPTSKQELADSLNPATPSYLSQTEIQPATGMSTYWYKLDNLTYVAGKNAIRVYVNGVRQYGTYQEGIDDGVSQPTTNVAVGDVVNAIKFTKPVGYGTIRIDVGPAAKSDERKVAVPVRTSTLNSYTTTNVDITEYRLVEQSKDAVHQYPLFDLYSVDGTAVNDAQPLWKFKEDSSAPVNINVGKRVIVNGVSNFVFEHPLFDGIRLLAYKEYSSRSNATLYTIWRAGSNDETYTPRKVNELREADTNGDWEVPAFMTQNVEHECRNTLSLVDVQQHFKDIISTQSPPPSFSQDGNAKWRLLLNPNYGIGGSIREFNHGFDTTISLSTVSQLNIPGVLRFSMQRYDEQLLQIRDIFDKQFVDILHGVDSPHDVVIGTFEGNGSFDVIFGDSPSYHDGVGIRNWVSTLPMMGLIHPVEPLVLVDSALGIYEVIHHDGHVSTPAFATQELNKLYSRVQRDPRTVVGTLASRPTSVDAAVNAVFYDQHQRNIYRNNIKHKGPVQPTGLTVGDMWVDTTTNILMEFDGVSSIPAIGDAWQLIDVNAMLLDVFYNIEQKLYDVSAPTVSVYDVTNQLNASEMKRRFTSFTKQLMIGNPYEGDYVATNAFTWNYSTLVQSDYNHNITQIIPSVSRWYTLYEEVFGTRYPHLMPWKLQAFDVKPDWWDIEYSTSSSRRWSQLMWDNIRQGIVPLGKTYPNGELSLGTSIHGTTVGGLSQFSVIPVNTTNTTTIEGGYGPDELLPPYFFSTYSADNYIVSNCTMVTTPPHHTDANAPYSFGDRGPVEDTWVRSIFYGYDLADITYVLDPIKFGFAVMGYDLVNVGGLLVDKTAGKVPTHRDMKFHGNAYDGIVHVGKGVVPLISQYLRYFGYDLTSSGIVHSWCNWRPQFGYLTGTFFDDQSLVLSTPSYFLDEGSYEVTVKRTPGYVEEFIDSLRIVVSETGLSTLDRGVRIPQGSGDDWVFRITTPNPTDHTIKLYGVTSVAEAQFRALSGERTGIVWSHFGIDKSVVHEFTPGESLRSLGADYLGIQGLINFVDGYAAYLQDIGFEFEHTDYPVFDMEYGRTIGWQFEIERAITQIYNGIATDSLPIPFYGLWNSVVADVTGNRFVVSGSAPLKLKTGDLVQLATTGALPIPFKHENVYYVVNASSTTFQLSNTLNGSPIVIQSVGRGMLSIGQHRFEATTPALYHEINPFRNNMFIRTPLGIVSDINEGSYVDLRTEQGVYDQYGRQIPAQYLRTFRSDTMTRIFMLPDVNNDIVRGTGNSRDDIHVGGAHIFIDGYEHVIIIKNDTTGATVLHDQFLGSYIRRLNVAYRGQVEPTFRPSVGGKFILDGKLHDNFEATVESIQRMYDTHLADENNDITKNARSLIGFDRQAYFDQLGLTPKSQLMFYRGMIQQKGSTNAVKAFVNSKQFINASVDEYWAYKVGEFGDAHTRVYPEFRLTVDDGYSDLMSFVFGDREFIPARTISVTPTSERWVNLPVLQQHLPEGVSFNAEPSLIAEYDANIPATFHLVDSVYDDVGLVIPFGSSVESVQGTTFVDVNEYIPGTGMIKRVTIYTSGGEMKHDSVSFVEISSTRLQLNTPAEITDVIHVERGGATLVSGTHYTMINNRVVSYNPTEILNTLSSTSVVKVYGFTVNRSVHDPIKIVDTTVRNVAEFVQLWDPAKGYHYSQAHHLVDFESSDPAHYTTSRDGVVSNTTAWHENMVGKLWWDNTQVTYAPYWDSYVFSDPIQQVSRWGSRTDRSMDALYEWIKSDMHPSQVVGAKRVLYKRKRNPVTMVFENNWVMEVQFKIDHQCFVDGYTVAVPRDGVYAVIVNGVEVDTITSVSGVVSLPLSIQSKDYVEVVYVAHQPTEDELDFDPDVEDDVSVDTQYKYFFEYTTVPRVLQDGTVKNTYYFWKQNTGNVYGTRNGVMVLNELKMIPTPFAVVSDMGDSTYTRLDIRGMRGRIGANNQYLVRLTYDDTLRDTFNSGDIRNEVHSEWQLIRQGQKNNIPRVLWDKLTDTMVGRTAGINPQPVPSLDMVLYDDLNGTNNRFGLANNQSMLPRERSVELLRDVLNDPTLDLFPVERQEFLDQYNFNDSTSLREAMETIYNTFLPSIVNRIWFTALYEGLATNIKYRGIFKTSWIQLDGVKLLDVAGD